MIISLLMTLLTRYYRNAWYIGHGGPPSSSTLSTIERKSTFMHVNNRFKIQYRDWSRSEIGRFFKHDVFGEKNNSIERCRCAHKVDAKRPIQVGSTRKYNYVSPWTLICFQATSNSHFSSASTLSILHHQLIQLCQMLSRTTCLARAQSPKFGAVLETPSPPRLILSSRLLNLDLALEVEAIVKHEILKARN